MIWTNNWTKQQFLWIVNCYRFRPAQKRVKCSTIASPKIKFSKFSARWHGLFPNPTAVRRATPLLRPYLYPSTPSAFRLHLKFLATPMLIVRRFTIAYSIMFTLCLSASSLKFNPWTRCENSRQQLASSTQLYKNCVRLLQTRFEN